MATQKPISTISYNTEPFLKEKLNSWLAAHIIQTFQYIKHIGEDGDKDHIHLRIEPNKKLDPMDLQDSLQEFVLGSNKPLGVRPFRPSVEEDWFLYAVHDSEYLKLKYNGGDKGEKIPYSFTDIVVPDNYDLQVAFVRAKAKLKHSTVNMATRLQSGVKPMDLILQGENPYLVNSLLHALSGHDYNRLAADYSKLQFEFDSLLSAISNKGFTVSRSGDGGFIID